MPTPTKGSARTLEAMLDELRAIRHEPTTAAALATLRRVLAGKRAHAVAKAAEIVAEASLGALAPDLVAAFERFMIDPAKSDPNCQAKCAITDALYQLGENEEAIFLRGIRHVQMEPVWGGRVDTAAALRVVCALGLVRCNYLDVMDELAELLGDPEHTARIGAAQAIAYSERADGTPLLRLKVLCGDREPEVIAECLIALVKLSPNAALPFVARRLDGEDEITCEAAALALGSARCLPAFDLLRQWWRRTVSSALRRSGLIAIAILRLDVAIDFLIDVVRQAPGPDARAALAALAMYRDDETIRTRVEEVVRGRTDVGLAAALAEAFPRGAAEKG